MNVSFFLVDLRLTVFLEPRPPTEPPVPQVLCHTNAKNNVVAVICPNSIVVFCLGMNELKKKCNQTDKQQRMANHLQPECLLCLGISDQTLKEWEGGGRLTICYWHTGWDIVGHNQAGVLTMNLASLPHPCPLCFLIQSQVRAQRIHIHSQTDIQVCRVFTFKFSLRAGFNQQTVFLTPLV